MKKHDDYIAGPHHYWIHFWCGAMFGAAISAWIAWRLLDRVAWTFGVVVVVASLLVGLACGRWGDRAWHWLIQKLPRNM